MFVLDTNVVSELRKAKTGRADPAVVRWTAGIPAGAMFISAITLLEIERGILLVERRDAGQGSLQRVWFNDRCFQHLTNARLPLTAMLPCVARGCMFLTQEQNGMP